MQTQLVCEQFSPILPGNYQETSYPLAIFLWTAHNPSDRPVTLSLMLTWQNLVGWFTNALKSPTVQVRDDGSPVYDYQPPLGESQGNFNQVILDQGRVGCLLDRQGRDPSQPVAEGEGQWAIATPLAPGTADVFLPQSLESPGGWGRAVAELQSGGFPGGCGG